MNLTFRSSVLLLGLAAAFVSAGAAGRAGPKLGLQSWTCRNMSFEEVVAFAEAHGIKHIEFISKHLGSRESKEEILRKKKYLQERGISAYSFGVVQPGVNKEANRRYFEFARLMEMTVIAVEPTDLAAWDNLEELAREYDIKLAIHNHGRGTTYGDPETVKKILATRDRRIGVCLDVGWVTAAGYDAAQVFREYGDRVYDLHYKDKSVTSGADGRSIVLDTEIGRGDVNFAGLFAEIKRTGWNGVLAIETDSKAFAENPHRLVAEARRFFEMQMAAAAPARSSDDNP